VKATEWMKQILEAKYEKVNIKDVVAQCKHLSNLNSNTCLQRKKEHYDITLHPDAMQNHIMHTIPKVHEGTLNMEL
jgi:hypothetical protein